MPITSSSLNLNMCPNMYSILYLAHVHFCSGQHLLTNITVYHTFHWMLPLAVGHFCRDRIYGTWSAMLDLQELFRDFTA